MGFHDSARGLQPDLRFRPIGMLRAHLSPHHIHGNLPHSRDDTPTLLDRHPAQAFEIELLRLFAFKLAED